MSDEMQDTLPAISEAIRQDIGINRPPDVVLAEAQRAARALKDVIDKKPRKVVFNGETYLEFEDWMTLGRFYGVTAKVTSTAPVEMGGITGFEAHAVALRVDGQEISAADAMCMSDEPNWHKKPLFQLRSMAQTRACSKVLRNVLAWVVVLAGYRPTPAEEMEGVVSRGGGSASAAPNQPSRPSGRVITEPQRKRLYAISMGTQHAQEDIGEWLKSTYGFKSSKEITMDTYEEIVNRIQDPRPLSQDDPGPMPPDDDIPDFTVEPDESHDIHQRALDEATTQATVRTVLSAINADPSMTAVQKAQLMGQCATKIKALTDAALEG